MLCRIAITSEHPGVCIVLIKSNRYERHVDEDGRSARLSSVSFKPWEKELVWVGPAGTGWV
jgi:hypothetical protein